MQPTTALVNYHADGTEFGSKLASNVHTVGCCLTWTLSYTLEIGAKLVQPLEPNVHGQWSATALEIGRRVLIVFAMLVLLPFDVTLAPVGAALRALATQARKDFVFIRPDTSELPAQAPKQLRVCSFNVALMPEFIAARNGLRPSSERVPEIAKAMMTRDDDVYCLQEAFHTTASNELAQSIRSKYPYIIYNVGTRVLGLNSGLMIASKYPLTNPHFWPHAEVGGDERMATKGLLGVEVRLSSTLKANVFNTHLNGHADETGPDGSSRTGIYFRARQIAGIQANSKQYVQRQEASVKVLATITCGDFNTGPKDAPNRVNPEWAAHQDFFRGDNQEYYDGESPPYELNPSSTGTGFETHDLLTGWDKTRIADWTLGTECLDHMLVAKSPPPLFSATEKPKIIRDNMDGSSDHLALRTTYPL